VEGHEVSPIPGAERWSYGAFQDHPENGATTIPLLREDGESVEFTIPHFVSDPEDLRRIALVVIGAREKWEDVEGLGG
jgi:hypothetical protein